MDGFVADQQHEDVGDVPDDGEAEGDEFPGEKPDVGVVVPVVVGVVGDVVDVVWGDELVAQGPADEADADDGEDDGDGAQDVLPEKFGVVGVHFLAGGTEGEHDWGLEKDIRFESFRYERDTEREREEMKILQ